MGTNWDINKFIGDNDLGLWKVKMKDVLIQQKFAEALKDEVALPATMLQANKTEMVDKAMSVIVLCHTDKGFREIVKEQLTSPTKSLMIWQLLKWILRMKTRIYSYYYEH